MKILTLWILSIPFILSATQPQSPVETKLEINVEGTPSTYTSAEVDLTQRSLDYQEAFCNLNKLYPSGNIYAVVAGISIDHIQDIDVLPQGSLMLITYGNHGSLRTEVVKTEEIEELGIRSISRSPVSVYFPSSSDEIPHDHHDIHNVDDVSHPHYTPKDEQ